jgi:hypothetical protein
MQGQVVSFAEEQKRDRAERLAITTLGWLGQEPSRIGWFLEESGIKPDFIRAAASTPGFLWGVLRFMSRNEALIAPACADLAVDPAAFAEALQVLDARHPDPEPAPKAAAKPPLPPRALFR